MSPTDCYTYLASRIPRDEVPSQAINMKQPCSLSNNLELPAAVPTVARDIGTPVASYARSWKPTRFASGKRKF